MKNHSRLMCISLILILLSFSTARAQSKLPDQKKNYAIAPKLPPAPKPEPFTVTTIPLPQNVILSDLVNYLPDGKHIIMEVNMAGSKKTDLAVMMDDGSDFKVLTGGLKESLGGEMPVPLPDGKRVYTPEGILECSPSILDCKEARILPLVYPEIPGDKIVWRIATNMSPDGIHVAYTVITAKHSGIILMSELTRVSDEKGERYELTKTKVIAGDKAVNDGLEKFRISVAGNGEMKSFSGRGRFLSTCSTFESNNFDIAKIDLETGEVTRFTRHFSYDEGVYPSPDGEWVVFQTHRQTTRMDAFGLIPRPLIAGLPLAAGVAYYRNQEVAPFWQVRRFYGLTMVDKYGDRARLPEDGYTGQDLTTADDNFKLYNHCGNFTWDPTSTKGIFWEQKDPARVKEGELKGRLRMIRFTSRKPTTPLEPFTPDPKWASKLEDLLPANTMNIPEEGTLNGAVSGYAKITTPMPVARSKEGPRLKFEYFNYSDDGVYILNGTESRTNSQGGFGQIVHWDADIQVTGKEQGFLKAQNVTFSVTSIASGTIQAALGKHKIEVDLSKGIPTGVPGELK